VGIITYGKNYAALVKYATITPQLKANPKTNCG
jgi:hypothetical protein